MGYDKVDLPDGESKFIDRKTGEVLEITSPEVPAGSKIITPQQQETWQKKQAVEAAAKLRRYDGEAFYFTANKNRCDLIKPQTLARLFFLATYLQPRKQVLYMSEREPMSKADMQSVLRLRKVAFYDFWREVD